MSNIIQESSKVINSSLGNKIKIYKDCVIRDSVLGNGVSIGDDTTIERCSLGDYVAINRRSYINDSFIGRFSYAGINTTINFTQIGNFCSLARNVDIGGFDHNYHKITTMPIHRFKQMAFGNKPDAHHEEVCLIGNDVWIAAGAQVLHKVKIGNGAVVGGGAVVTKDVPPYAIVAGVPAKIIGYRFSEQIVISLEEIKWWDWPEDVLMENMEWLINNDVNIDVIDRLFEIGKGIENRKVINR